MARCFLRKRLLRQEVKGQGLERISHQQGGGLIERNVTRRSTPAQDIVVHTGEIVVNQ